MHEVYLSLGGNIGNKKNNFIQSYQLITKHVGETIVSSAIYETPPWGFQSKDNFWNQVIKVQTELSPQKMLEQIQLMEKQLGRKYTKEGYESRPIDVDILYFDNLILETENLIIPHPLIQNRKFVLVPLAEIAPDFIHPVLKQTNIQLLEKCKDDSEITKIEK